MTGPTKAARHHLSVPCSAAFQVKFLYKAYVYIYIYTVYSTRKEKAENTLVVWRVCSILYLETIRVLPSCSFSFKRRAKLSQLSQAQAHCRTCCRTLGAEAVSASTGPAVVASVLPVQDVSVGKNGICHPDMLLCSSRTSHLHRVFVKMLKVWEAETLPSPTLELKKSPNVRPHQYQTIFWLTTSCCGEKCI